MSDSPTPTGGDQVADRRTKLATLRDEFGVDPYGRRVDGLTSLAGARDLFDEAKEGDDRPAVTVAGRVVLHRDIGKLVFMTIRDGSGDIQIAASKKSVDDLSFRIAKIIDLGDIIVARGRVGATKTGEITVWSEPLDGRPAIEMACKSLVPAPEKWKGLKDTELRYRQRYVDLYANPDAMATLKQRCAMISRSRRFFEDLGYLEVETPMLQPIAGGAAARPFITHHNAMDMDLYLRIAPELYLKRLLVGGLPKVFEINRNFRNEGIDRNHNPEFTMIELYEAFADYNVMATIVEGLTRLLATDVIGATTVTFDDWRIDLAKPFRRATYHELFEQVNGFDAADAAKVRKLAKQLEIDPGGRQDELLLREVWETTVEASGQLVQPIFVMDYPAALSPLTRRKKDLPGAASGGPGVAERFELYIANMEIANAYTELNDPDVQEANFTQQLAGLDDEQATLRNLDEDFLNALRVGMPPAGGMGIGIDRLIMILTGTHSLREVIAFPLVRPRGD